MRKIAIIMIICLTCCISCNNDFHFGKYQNSRVGMQLLINQDSTYSYQEGFMHLILHSSGKWKMNQKKQLLLNSYFQDSIRIKSITEIIQPEPRILVNMDVIDQDKDAVYGCFIVLNGKFLVDSTKSGFSSSFTTSENIDSVSVCVIKTSMNSNRTFKIIQTPVYQSKNKNTSISFNFLVDDRLFDQLIFANKLVNKRKRKIIIFDEYTQKNTVFKLHQNMDK